MLFDVRIVPAGRWDLLCVVGDMDLATIPALRQALDRTESPDVAVDLSGVDHLDPVTLGVLFVGSLRSRRAGGRFAVVCPAGPARDLLVELGVDCLLEVLAAQVDLPI